MPTSADQFLDVLSSHQLFFKMLSSLSKSEYFSFTDTWDRRETCQFEGSQNSHFLQSCSPPDFFFYINISLLPTAFSISCFLCLQFIHTHSLILCCIRILLRSFYHYYILTRQILKTPTEKEERKEWGIKQLLDIT